MAKCNQLTSLPFKGLAFGQTNIVILTYLFIKKVKR